MSNSENPDRDRLIDKRAAAALLGKHPAVLADWRHQQRGPKYVKYGKSVRYRIGDLVEWIEAHTIDPGVGGEK